ncbi:M23 family metallopeptidase [Larkinella insperata]
MALWLLYSSLMVKGQISGTSDSLRLVLDSLEMALLKTTRTYAHVDRLIQAFPLRVDYLDRLPSVLPVAVPFREFSVSSPFRVRKHPIRKKSRFHGGIDIRAKEGVSVWATAPGIVKRVSYDEDLGLLCRLCTVLVLKRPTGICRSTQFNRDSILIGAVKWEVWGKRACSQARTCIM